jgi:hypothetical protein
VRLDLWLFVEHPAFAQVAWLVILGIKNFTLHRKRYTLYGMRVLCLYRPNTDTERPVLELQMSLKRIYNSELELVSVDGVEGSRLAELYDIWQFPAFIAVDSSGTLLKSWSDGTIPLLNELIYYLQQA